MSRRTILGGAAGLAMSGAMELPAFAASMREGPVSGPADTILSGGNIWTMDAAAPRAEAIAIRGGRIMGIGSLREVERLRDHGTRMLDLGGKTVMPGFIDPHIHFAFVALDDFADVSARRVPTIAALQKLLRHLAESTPAGGWVRGQKYDPSIMQDRRGPTIAELDAAVPDHPVFILESNGHVGYANSKAFALAGVTAQTPDALRARFIHDGDGNLTGRLEESAAMLPFISKMPVASETELTARAMRVARQAARVGCTMVHDCGIGVTARSELHRLAAISSQGSPVRLRGMLVTTVADAWDEMGLKPGFGDDRFRVRGMKAWSDGSNQARTGYMREPYLGTDKRGELNFTPEQLAKVVRRAHDGGWQVGVHANGDAAIDVTIDAYRQALAANPRRDHRHRIEHCSMLHPEQIAQMVELGLSPSFLIGHVRIWGTAFEKRIIGPERVKFYDPCRSAQDAGLRISLHSDFSVTPIEPLQMVETAVTRVKDEDGGVLNPDQRLTVGQAFRAVTIDAAWQLGDDHHAGSLAKGKFADLVVLDEDPFRVPANEIASIPVNQTWLEGQEQGAAAS
ncbi:MAG: amidohydrolase [Sphingomonadales bacterium]|nr:amidohydrolase [Sphingomonadales bacterium]